MLVDVKKKGLYYCFFYCNLVIVIQTLTAIDMHGLCLLCSKEKRNLGETIQKIEGRVGTSGTKVKKNSDPRQTEVRERSKKT